MPLLVDVAASVDVDAAVPHVELISGLMLPPRGTRHPDGLAAETKRPVKGLLTLLSPPDVWSLVIVNLNIWKLNNSVLHGKCLAKTISCPEILVVAHAGDRSVLRQREVFVLAHGGHRSALGKREVVVPAH